MKGKAQRLHDRAGPVKIWEEPAPRRRYVIGADVSESKQRDVGTVKFKPGQNVERPDYQAAVVLELESCRHVASFRGYQPPYDYAESLAALGTWYNDARLAVEINGPGLSVIERLVRNIHYPSMYRNQTFAWVDTDDPHANTWGWRTTQQSRHMLIGRIHQAIKDGLQTLDARLVLELRTMQFAKDGVPRAMNRDKDDMVMALGIALQARSEQLGLGDFAETKKEPDIRPEDIWAWKKAMREKEVRSARDRDDSGVARLGSLDRLRNL